MGSGSIWRIFFLLRQYLLPEKVSFSQVFKFLYKLLVLPKYWISFLHAYIFTRLLFAAMKYLPSGFFSPTTCSVHICLAQLSHVTTTKTTAEQGGGRGAKSALICLLLWKQSITGTADFDNYIQEKFDRSATLLSLCWPTYRKCEQVLRNKEQGLLGRALIRTTIVMFLMWPY